MRMRSGVEGMIVVVGLLAAALGSPPAASGQEKVNPIYTFVKQRLKNPARPFTLIITLKVKEGQGKKLEESFAKASKATRKEKGCLRYELNRDTEDATLYLVYERWQSSAALKTHLETAHIKTLLADLPALLAGVPAPRVLIPTAD